ncbi:unnamed protein product, partial [Prorocentrum cordatum]
RGHSFDLQRIPQDLGRRPWPRGTPVACARRARTVRPSGGPSSPSAVHLLGSSRLCRGAALRQRPATSSACAFRPRRRHSPSGGMPKIKAKVSGKGNVALTAELLRKTRLCVFYAQGACSRGDACTFAHGSSEVAARPDFTRTQVCETFKTTGHCAKGDACLFAHNVGNLKKWGRCVPGAERASPKRDAGPRWTSLDSLGAQWPPGDWPAGALAGGRPVAPGGGPPGRAARPRAVDQPPGNHKLYDDCSSADGTASTGTASMSTTLAATVAIQAIRKWQGRGHVLDIAGPPGLVACELYRRTSFYHEQQKNSHARLEVGHFEVGCGESSPVEGDTTDEDVHPKEFPPPPAQPPPPPPRQWLGEPATVTAASWRL